MPIPSPTTSRSLPPKNCDVCGKVFVPANTSLVHQRLCGSDQCRRTWKRIYSMRYEQEHKEEIRRNKLNWYVKKEPRLSLPAIPFTRCYKCASAYQETKSACPVCGAVYDKKRCSEAFIRAQKKYEDIVRENAKRAGKDPGKAWRNARNSGNPFTARFNYKKTFQTISAWLHNRKKNRPSI